MAASRNVSVVGARENNLRDLSVEFPRRSLNVVTGVSGSGKSTLAFDIVFAEGQRRFLESVSTFARQYVEQLPRPAVDHVTGIPPTVAVEQRLTRGSRKSIVATVAEVAPFLRLLYARAGVQYHPDTGGPVAEPTASELRAAFARALGSARRKGRALVCAPLVRGRKGHHRPLAAAMARRGIDWLQADGRRVKSADFPALDRYRDHDIDAIVFDSAESDAAASRVLDEALELGRGTCFIRPHRGAGCVWFSSRRCDPATGESFPDLDPKQFSFHSPRGWCPTCRGYGRRMPAAAAPDDGQTPEALRELHEEFADAGTEDAPACDECGGARLNRLSRAVRLRLRGGAGSISLPELLSLTAPQALERLDRLKLDARARAVAAELLPPVRERLRFLERVGLGYLCLDRSAASLSGGEGQRIRLAAHLGSNLSGALYVLDEPSIGLHPRDNDRLIESLLALRDRGNTLLVVEHDEALMRRADRLIDLGPGAGAHGGRLLANAPPEMVMKDPASATGAMLARGMNHPIRGSRRPLPPADAESGWIRVEGARLRNLRSVSVRVPLGRLTVVAGPSGAGKSTLFRELLGPAVASRLRSRGRSAAKGCERLELGGEIRGVVEVDQSPLGKTPRSTPATYLGIFDRIRRFFAELPESRVRGYGASRFSFNTGAGRCPVCEGAGRIRLEMAFMPDAFVGCEACGGSRYGPEMAGIAWKGSSISEVLRMSFEQAAQFFSFDASLAGPCRLMVDCGLGYLELGQSSPTLSGGEAQRLKLVAELARAGSGAGGGPGMLYLLEEPTIGLHLSDCEKLLGVLHALVDRGHTVIVIEHHPDLLAEADYLVEIGPGGGPDGGRLVYQGAPEGILRVPGSPTAPYLAGKLKGAVTSPPRRSRRAP